MRVSAHYLQRCSGTHRLGNREDTDRSRIPPCWSSGHGHDKGPAHTHQHLEKKRKNIYRVGVRFKEVVCTRTENSSAFLSLSETSRETHLDTLGRRPQIQVGRSRRKPSRRCSCSRLAGECRSRGFRLGSDLLGGSPLQDRATGSQLVN